MIFIVVMTLNYSEFGSRLKSGEHSRLFTLYTQNPS